jgi:hypothetical protein
LAQVPDILVSDAERERVADDLRGHYEAGRLTLDEFQQRLVSFTRRARRGS